MGDKKTLGIDSNYDMAVHEKVTQLLPWHVNDTLSGKDEELVLKHLAMCEDCQQERSRLYELQKLVRESDVPVSDPEASFKKTWARVEAAENNRSSVREIEKASRATRRFLPAAMAAGLLLLVGMVGLQQTDDGGEYQTLSSEPLPEGELRRMELGFEQPIPAVTLRKALIETGSNIVSGPDAAGVYIVEVRISDEKDDASYLAALKDIEGVRHAAFTPR